MAYSVNVLTTAGQAKLAGASSANRLIYTRVLSSEDAFTAEEAAVSTPVDYTGPVGFIAAASAIENVARIVGTIRNTTSSQYELKSFALCGRLEGDSTDVVIAVLSDSAASVILPPAGGPSSAAAVAFSLVISAGAAGMVDVTSAASATLPDLDRFVSAHKAGDTHAGDDQSIYGAKNFIGNVTFDGAVQCEGPFAATSGFVVDEINGNLASFTDIHTGQIGYRLANSYAASTVYTHDSDTGTDSVSLALSNVELSLSTDGTATAPEFDVRIAATHILYASYDSDLDLFVLETQARLYPSAGMSGMAPYADNADTSVTVPVGGLITIWLPNTGSGVLVAIEAGRTLLDVSANQYKTAYNAMGTWGAGERYVPAGKYTALMDVLHTNGDAWGLFMRVA